MTRRSYKRQLLGLLLLSGIALAVTPAASVTADEPNPEGKRLCMAPHACGAELFSLRRVQHWRSPEEFRDVVLNISFFVNKKRLPRTEVGECRATYRGYGLVTEVNVCGKGFGPIRITYASTKPTIFTIGYQVESKKGETRRQAS
jgi:hypothetical protein